MSNNFLQAMDIVAQNKINGLKFDKTIVANIIELVPNEENAYRVKYETGILKAYAENEIKYNINDSVYINIPEGDYSNKKFIVGKANSQVNADKVNQLNRVLVYDSKSYKGLPNEKDANIFNFSSGVTNYFTAYRSKYLKVSAEFKGNIDTAELMEAENINNLNVYGIKLWLTTDSDTINTTNDKFRIFNIHNMSGNVFSFPEWTKQSVYYSIDEDFFVTKTNDNGTEETAAKMIIAEFFNDLSYTSSNEPMQVRNITLEFCEAIDFTSDNTCYIFSNGYYNGGTYKYEFVGALNLEKGSIYNIQDEIDSYAYPVNSIVSPNKDVYKTFYADGTKNAPFPTIQEGIMHHLNNE